MLLKIIYRQYPWAIFVNVRSSYEKGATLEILLYCKTPFFGNNTYCNFKASLC